MIDLQQTRSQVITQNHKQTNNFARIYAEEAASSINAIDYALLGLRAEWKYGPEAFATQVQNYQTRLNPSVAFQVGIIDAYGILLFSSTDLQAKPIDLSDREHFTVHRDRLADELFISKPVIGRVVNRWTIQFTRPLRNAAGQFDGVIVLSVSPEYFSRFQQTVDLGRDSSISLIRLDGAIISRYPDLDLALGKSVTNAPYLNQPLATSGLYEKRAEVDNIQRLFGWKRLPNTELVVSVGQSLDVLFEQYRRQRTTYILSGAAGSLMLLVAGFFLLIFVRQRARDVAAMAEMQRDLQHSQKLEAIGRLTGGVAHDFNNILQIISANIQILQLSSVDPKVSQRLDNTLSAVDRGAKLSSQLLTFARRQPLKSSVVNIGKKLEDIGDLLKPLMGAECVIKLSIAADLWNTLIDPDLFHSVVLNLAINAQDAMNGRGTLTIALSNALLDHENAAWYPEISAGEYVQLEMTDTGCGMSPEVMERAFDPFYTTKKEGKGTGLGLSMAYGFVKQSGGHIKLESEVGLGTTIRIFLPRSLRAETSTSPTAAHHPMGGTETVLVVDDDEQVQAGAKAMLKNLGYRTLETGNAKRALKILEQDPSVDVLFTDVVMPGKMDGIALAKRAQEIRPNLIVLLTSGYSYDVMQNGGQLDPGMDLLKKPYKREQLDAAIRELLARRSN